MTINFKELNQMQLDALREVGNVGAGNSATALSVMVNRKIDMRVPNIEVLGFNEILERIGGADKLVAGIYLKVDGDAAGNILIVLPIKSAKQLINTLMQKEINQIDEETELDEFSISTLQEIGNILSGAYLGALSTFTNIRFDQSVPSLAVDMAGAVVSIVITILGEVGDEALLLETEFWDGNEQIKGHFFLLPEPGSMEKILSSLGLY